MADKKPSQMTDIGTLAATDKWMVERLANTTAYYATPDTLKKYTAGAGISVKQYGAVGNGVADDTAAIQAAWAALTTGETLVLPAGTYAVSDTVAWKDKVNITIQGRNATIIARTGSNFTGKPLVDMAGTCYAKIEGLLIDCVLAINQPITGLVLGRTATLTGGANCFSGCWFTGLYTFSVVYNCCAELNQFDHCRFLSNNIYPCYYTDSDDPQSLCFSSGTSNCCTRFYDCTFLNYSTTSGQKLIIIEGVTKDISFRDCYLYISNVGYAWSLEGGTSSLYGLIIDNVRIEGAAVGHANSRMVYMDMGNDVQGSQITHFYWAITSDVIFESTALCVVEYSEIWALYAFSATNLITTASEWLYNTIVGRGNGGLVSTGAGGFRANHIIWFGSASPFTGTSEYFMRQDNIVNRMTGYDGELGVAVRYVWGARLVDADGVTPLVTGKEQIELRYVNPTTITNFTGATTGQELTLIDVFGTCTIQHNGTIHLAGSVNYVMAANGLLILQYRPNLSGWWEVGRTVP